MAVEQDSGWSADRTSRLRVLCLLVLALSALLGGLAVHSAVVLVPDDRGLLGFTVVLAVAAAAIGGCALAALRALRVGDPRARGWLLATGVLLLVAALPLAGLWLALLLPVLGIGVLALTLAREDAGGEPR